MEINWNICIKQNFINFGIEFLEEGKISLNYNYRKIVTEIIIFLWKVIKK